LRQKATAFFQAATNASIPLLKWPVSGGKLRQSREERENQRRAGEDENALEPTCGGRGPGFKTDFEIGPIINRHGTTERQQAALLGNAGVDAGRIAHCGVLLLNEAFCAPRERGVLVRGVAVDDLFRVLLRVVCVLVPTLVTQLAGERIASPVTSELRTFRPTIACWSLRL
jgi:hypothetical protein